MLKNRFNVALGVVVLMAATLFSACGPKTLIDETHVLKENKWMRFEPEAFLFDVTNTSDCYQVTMTMSYDTNILKLESLPLVVDFFADSNELHNFILTFRMFDRKGDRRGTLEGSMCTVSDTLDRFRFFNHAATYTYRIKQRTSRYELFGISSVGLKVEETDLSQKQTR